MKKVAITLAIGLLFNNTIIASQLPCGYKFQKENFSICLGLRSQSWEQCGKSYKGLKVTISCSNLDEEMIWGGSITFSPLGLQTGTLFPHTRYNPMILFKYELFSEKGESNYRRSFGVSPPQDHKRKKQKNIEEEAFSYYRDRRLDEGKIHKGNVIDWTIQGTFISIQEVLDAICSLKSKKDNKFPKYELVGYEAYNPATNCVGFSSRLLKALGVTMECMPNYAKWLAPVKKVNPVGYLLYYATVGYFTDSINADFLIRNIHEHKSTIKWKRDRKESRRATFYQAALENLVGKNKAKEYVK